MHVLREENGNTQRVIMRLPAHRVEKLINVVSKLLKIKKYCEIGGITIEKFVKIIKWRDKQKEIREVA